MYNILVENYLLDIEYIYISNQSRVSFNNILSIPTFLHMSLQTWVMQLALGCLRFGKRQPAWEHDSRRP